MYICKLLHRQNNNELTLTLATHSAINVLYVYHVSSTCNTCKVANVNKKYTGIYVLLDTIGLSIMVRQWNLIIISNVANYKTQIGPYDYLLIIIGAS